ncbi:MAG: YgjV family protein, partial [Clostridia bacterium]|nr:YgjV family protein [Clostridia bacterium]
MSTGTIYEIIGYTGSALVVISMLMTSIIRLRVINLTGSLIFTVYALLIRSYPTAAMNVFLVGINVWHLIRLQKTSRHYDVIRTDPADSTFVYL